MDDTARTRPPDPPLLGEVVISIYGTTVNDLSVSVSAQDGTLTLEDAEALALLRLQQRSARQPPSAG